MTFTRFEEFIYRQESGLILYLITLIFLCVLTLVSYLFFIPLFILSIWIIFISHFSDKRELFKRKLESGEYY